MRVRKLLQQLVTHLLMTVVAIMVEVALETGTGDDD
jgi:hypothetical protein